MLQTKPNQTKPLILTLLSLAIAACGGGGGGGESTSNTSPNNDPAVNNSTNNNTNTNNTTPQTPVAENNGLGVINNKLAAPVVNASVAKAGRFLFKWDFVPNAAYYRLMKSVDGKQPYQQVGEKLLTNSTTEDISTFEHDWQNTNYVVQACDAEGCSLSSKIYTGNVMLNMIAYIKDKAFQFPIDSDLRRYKTHDLSITDVSSDNFNIKASAKYEDQCSAASAGMMVNGFTYCPASSLAVLNFSQAVSGDDWRFASAKESYKSVKENNNFALLAWCKGEGCLVNVSDTPQLGTAVTEYFYKASLRTQSVKAGDNYCTNWTWMMNNRVCMSSTTAKTDMTLEDCTIAPVEGFSQTWGTIYGGGTTIPQFCRDFAKKYQESASYVYIVDLSSYSGDAIAGFKTTTPNNYRVFTTNQYTIAVKDNNTIEIYENGYRYDDNAGQKLIFTKQNFDAADLKVFVASDDSQKLSIFNDKYTFNVVGSGVTEIQKQFFARKETDKVVIYRFDSAKGDYQQYGELKSSNYDPADGFGDAVAFSADGLTIAVGAPFEDSAAVGINGDQSNNKEKDSGAVYVFRFINNEWKQIAYVKATNTGANDNFGSSVGLSPDGKRLVVFAPNEASASTQNTGGNQQDNSKPKAGAVYVY